MYDFIFGCGKGLNENVGKTYFMQLMDAIKYCHSLGIIHRDISLQNLLLNSKFELKLSDFGCSQIINNNNNNSTYSTTDTNTQSKEKHKEKEEKEEKGKEKENKTATLVTKPVTKQIEITANTNTNTETKTKTNKRNKKRDIKNNSNNSSFIFGTAGYQAPEVLECKEYDNSIDIFSCGVVLFIMLAGYRPFNNGKKHDIPYKYIYKQNYATFWKWHAKRYGFKAQKSLTKSKQDSSKVSRLAIDLITKMIVYDKKDRIKLQDIFKHPWYTNGTRLNSQELKTIMAPLYQQCIINKK